MGKGPMARPKQSIKQWNENFQWWQMSLDDKIDVWHNKYDGEKTLQEFLEMDDEDYQEKVIKQGKG